MDGVHDAEVGRVQIDEQSINDECKTVQECNGSGRSYVVRRLIPRECARLQGFPPDWCDDVPHSDSAEYKLWGNGIALPTIIPMMQAAKAVIEQE